MHPFSKDAFHKNSVPAMILIFLVSTGIGLEVKWLYDSWTNQGWLYSRVAPLLGIERHPEAVAYVRFEHDPDPMEGFGLDVRVAALHALSQNVTPESIRAIARILESDPDSELRRHAAFILGSMDDPLAVPPLHRTIQSLAPVEVRKAAVLALGQMDRPDAREALLSVLHEITPALENP